MVLFKSPLISVLVTGYACLLSASLAITMTDFHSPIMVNYRPSGGMIIISKNLHFFELPSSAVDLIQSKVRINVQPTSIFNKWPALEDEPTLKSKLIGGEIHGAIFTGDEIKQIIYFFSLEISFRYDVSSATFQTFTSHWTFFLYSNKSSSIYTVFDQSKVTYLSKVEWLEQSMKFAATENYAVCDDHGTVQLQNGICLSSPSFTLDSCSTGFGAHDKFYVFGSKLVYIFGNKTGFMQMPISEFFDDQSMDDFSIRSPVKNKTGNESKKESSKLFFILVVASIVVVIFLLVLLICVCMCRSIKKSIPPTEGQVAEVVNQKTRPMVMQQSTTKNTSSVVADTTADHKERSEKKKVKRSSKRRSNEHPSQKLKCNVIEPMMKQASDNLPVSLIGLPKLPSLVSNQPNPATKANDVLKKKASKKQTTTVSMTNRSKARSKKNIKSMVVSKKGVRTSKQTTRKSRAARRKNTQPKHTK